MRKAILFLFVFTALTLFSYTCWEENGIPIRKSYSLNYSNSMIRLDNGQIITVWSDDLSEKQEMKIQKTGENGENVWEEPIVLSQYYSGRADGQKIIETSYGYIVAVWFEYSNPVTLRYQKFDNDGNLLWGENGIAIDLDFWNNDPIDMNVIADNDGGFYIIYNWCNVKAIRITSDGEISEGWNPAGNSLFSSSSLNRYSCIPDGNGGIITAAFTYINNQCYLQRCNSAGDLIWSEDGISLGEINKIKLLNWEDGEFAYITYNYDEMQLMVNVIGLDGNSVLDEPQILVEFPDEIANLKFNAVKTSDGKIGLIYADSYDPCLRAQKIMIGETPEWGEGVVIDENDNIYAHFDFNLVSDNSGGIYVSWFISLNCTENFFIEHVNNDGVIEINDLEISNADIYYSTTPLLFHDEVLETTISWFESSNGNQKIKLQKIDNNGNVLFPEGGNSIWELLNGEVLSNLTNFKSNGEYSLVCWNEHRYSFYDNSIYVQLINNETGELLFSDQGLAISNNTDCRQESASLCFNESGNRFCIAYIQTITTLEDEGATVQILDLEGNRLLGDNGYSLSSETLDVYISNISVCSAGDDFLVSWSENYDDLGIPVNSLRIQKFVNNQPIWANPVLLNIYDMVTIEVVSLEDNYLVWTEEIFPYGETTLKIATINGEGEIEEQWGETGLAIDLGVSASYIKTLVTEDGIVVFWNDLGSRYFQYISNDGDILWEYGPMEYECNPADVSLIDDKMICFCVPYDESASFFLEIDIDEAGGWDEPEVLGYTWIDASDYNVSMDIWEDVIILYWANEQEDIMADFFDLSGNQLAGIPYGGIEICSNSQEQSLCQSNVDESGRSIVAWLDYRGSGDRSIYAQMIDINIVPSSDNEIYNENLMNICNYPNPFVKSTTLKFEFTRETQPAEILIYNVKGQKIRSITAESEEVIWDCKDDNGNPAAAGVYFFRLKADENISNTGKMVLIK